MQAKLERTKAYVARSKRRPRASEIQPVPSSSRGAIPKGEVQVRVFRVQSRLSRAPAAFSSSESLNRQLAREWRNPWAPG